MENQEITIKRNEIAQNWSKFGLAKIDLDLELKKKSDDIIKSLEIVVTKDNVIEAENTLKVGKSEVNKVVELRKTLTDKLDNVKAALMTYEKSLPAYVQKLEQSIIEVKKVLAKEKAEKEIIEKEQKDELLSFQNYCNNHELQYKSFVNERVQKAYDWAIDNPQPIPLDNFFNGVKTKIINEAPKFVFELKHNKHLIAPILDVDISDLLAAKFVSYEFDLKNVEEAKKKQKEEAERVQQDLEKEKQQKDVATLFTSNAAPLEVISGIKDLKKVYKIEMEETFENAMMLIASFLANKEKAKDKTTTKKWFGFSASNCITALEKLKNEDNNFSPSGIKFVEVDKL
jgi:hypothetical protein